MNFEWWETWHDFRLTAVVADLPGNTHLDFDFLLPIDFVTRSGMAIDTWDVSAYRTYVRLADNADPAEANTKIAGIMREHVPEYESDVALFPSRDIHLHYIPRGAKASTYVMVLSLIGLIVLVMACVNFVNLSTARAALRAREVGIRKVIGATRRQLVGLAHLDAQLRLPDASHCLAVHHRGRSRTRDRLADGQLAVFPCRDFQPGRQPAARIENQKAKAG